MKKPRLGIHGRKLNRLFSVARHSPCCKKSALLSKAASPPEACATYIQKNAKRRYATITSRYLPLLLRSEAMRPWAQVTDHSCSDPRRELRSKSALPMGEDHIGYRGRNCGTCRDICEHQPRAASGRPINESPTPRRHDAIWLGHVFAHCACTGRRWAAAGW